MPCVVNIDWVVHASLEKDQCTSGCVYRSNQLATKDDMIQRRQEAFLIAVSTEGRFSWLQQSHEYETVPLPTQKVVPTNKNLRVRASQNLLIMTIFHSFSSIALARFFESRSLATWSMSEKSTEAAFAAAMIVH